MEKYSIIFNTTSGSTQLAKGALAFQEDGTYNLSFTSGKLAGVSFSGEYIRQHRHGVVNYRIQGGSQGRYSLKTTLLVERNFELMGLLEMIHEEVPYIGLAEAKRELVKKAA